MKLKELKRLPIRLSFDVLIPIARQRFNGYELKGGINPRRLTNDIHINYIDTIFYIKEEIIRATFIEGGLNFINLKTIFLIISTNNN